ncbi:hypothetical protein AYO44_04620 [Planctomycetaceae bacterium SCGC AG-212-F19]|nr:hypothetical protein AYO44_04620 [Planctomycetaceae bacterium SCGC AG-212-F19]
MENSDVEEIDRLINDLGELRADMLHIEKAYHGQLSGVAPPHAASARNLLHYLALRRHDVRRQQERLATLGLSSLGRAEAHVLASLDAVLRLLHRLAGRAAPAHVPPAVGFAEGPALLEQHTRDLLGNSPADRSVRIMVTMPGEAAGDYALVRDLLAVGMDCMRINCAHDGADA